MTEWAGPWNGRGTMTSETNLFLLAVPATACLAWLPRTSSLVIWGSLRRSWQRAGTGLDSGLSQLSSGQWSGEGWVPWSLHVYTSDIHLHRMTEAHDHVCREGNIGWCLLCIIFTCTQGIKVLTNHASDKCTSGKIEKCFAQVSEKKFQQIHLLGQHSCRQSLTQIL